MRLLADTDAYQEIRSWCLLCGSDRDLDNHHIVYRSIKRDDSPANLVLLCRSCHDDVHAKKVDLLPSLSTVQQMKAVELTGSIESARILLAPSAYREPAPQCKCHECGAWFIEQPDLRCPLCGAERNMIETLDDINAEHFTQETGYVQNYDDDMIPF